VQGTTYARLAAVILPQNGFAILRNEPVFVILKNSLPDIRGKI
jgi:hypothetical protein